MSSIEIFPSRFPGERIKRERLRLKIKTQAEAAERFGVSRETWSRYETDKLEMGKDVWRRFVEAGADADYLTSSVPSAVFESLNEQGGLPVAHQDPGVGPMGALVSKSEQEILRAYRLGDSDDRDTLLHVARGILKRVG